jgi:Tol biopolymer transport system component
MHPAIRPGTQEVVFEHIIRQDHIWRMDLKQPEAARRPEQITRSTWSDYGPMLSPDGTQLAFASDQSGSPEVWVTAADGSGVPRQLTRAGQARRTIYPSGWTPDGRAVSVFPLDAPADVEIGSGRSVAVRIDAKDPARPHFWSRDGGTIFYFGWDNGRTNLWAKQVGSGRVVQLTRDRAATAAESFDGKTIYFSRYDQYPPGLLSVPAAGGEEKLVIPDARGDVWAVARDGIYYFDFRDGSRNRYLPRDVSRYDFATGRTQRVARVTSNGTVNLLPGFAVSSDGRWIYWSQRDYQSSDIASLHLNKPH